MEKSKYSQMMKGLERSQGNLELMMVFNTLDQHKPKPSEIFDEPQKGTPQKQSFGVSTADLQQAFGKNQL